jgi:hypothetical protein
MRKLLLLFFLYIFLPRISNAISIQEFQGSFLPMFYERCGETCTNLRRIGCNVNPEDPLCALGECDLKKVKERCLQWFDTLPGKGDRPVFILVQQFGTVYILVRTHGHLVFIGSQSTLGDYDEEQGAALASKAAKVLQSVSCTLNDEIAQ